MRRIVAGFRRWRLAACTGFPWPRALLAIVAMFLLGVLVGWLLPDAATEASPVVIKRSSTPPWIEVWVAGELCCEWQPADGAVYERLSGYCMP